METAKPRILLVSATPGFAGGEIHYIKLARLLREHYELGAVVFNSILHSEFEEMGVKVWRGESSAKPQPIKKYFPILRSMQKALREFSPALVHLNGGPEAYLSFIARLHKSPVLITNHILRRVAFSEMLKRFVLAVNVRCAAMTICVSATAQNNLRKYAWTNKSVVIPNWIQQVPELRCRPPYDGNRPFRLLFVGRVEPAKGIYELIEAMKYLRNVSLDVVGEGAGLAYALGESAGFPVHFHGFMKDVASFYRKADLLVFPSHSEGQGLVLIEAMSYGLPCLASDTEAALETSCNGRFAEIFRCGDPVDLAQKIQELQGNAKRLIELSEAARSHALRTYAEELLGKAYVDLFQPVLKAGTA